jgi:hypothetical protein
MRILDLHRSPPLRAIAMLIVGAPLVLLPPLSSTAQAHALAPSASSFDDLTARADDRRAAGAYAESAALYGQAYRARPERQRADQIGEITIRSAMTDYELAWAARPDLALLEAEAQLLEDFLEARRKAQATAQAKHAKKLPEVPQDLVDELDRLKTRIAEQRDGERKAVTEAATPEPELKPWAERKPEPSAPIPVEPVPTPIARRKGDAAIHGVGLGAVVGGTALIAGGAGTLARTKEIGDARLRALDADPCYTDAQRHAYRSALGDWQQHWRNTSTALVVTGAVLAATGIGLTSWGIVRVRKHRSRSRSHAAVTPALARQHLGVRLTVVF